MNPEFEKWFRSRIVPDTSNWRSRLPKQVSFDFDGCLEIDTVQEYAKSLVAKGLQLWVITSRLSEEDYHGSDPNVDLYKVIEYVGIPKNRVVYLGDKKDKHQYFKINDEFIWYLDDDWDDVNKINIHTKVRSITNFGNPNWKKECEALLV